MSLTVGVDVGGTKIAAGVVDESGTVLEKVRLPSPADNPQLLLQAITGAVEELRRRHEVTAVGVGAAGFVAKDRRRLYFAPYLQWGDGPVADRLAASLGLPVVIENDANAAAWAEFTHGAGQGVPDQLMVALGTGVGGGLILGGELYRGGHGVAAEIGHLGLVWGGLPCPCGQLGCFEQYASGSALQREARAAAATGAAPRLLAAAGGDSQAVTGSMVTELAQAGEEEALALFKQLAEALAAGIGSLVAVLDPSLVVLGGGVSDAGDVLLDPTREALQREVTAGDRRPLPELRLAALGNSAGLIGAADLARRAAAESSAR